LKENGMTSDMQSPPRQEAFTFTLTDNATRKQTVHVLREAPDDALAIALASMEQQVGMHDATKQQIDAQVANCWALVGALKYEIDRRTRSIVIAGDLRGLGPAGRLAN
jgi:hypothetical protein